MVNRKSTVGSFRRVAVRNKTNMTFLGRYTARLGAMSTPAGMIR
jgi:hypothetical protein